MLVTVCMDFDIGMPHVYELPYFLWPRYRLFPTVDHEGDLVLSVTLNPESWICDRVM